jgi:hypothetical protein
MTYDKPALVENEFEWRSVESEEARYAYLIQF